MKKRRIVVTGVGTKTGLGNNSGDTLSKICSGISGIKAVPERFKKLYDLSFASVIKDSPHAKVTRAYSVQFKCLREALSQARLLGQPQVISAGIYMFPPISMGTEFEDFYDYYKADRLSDYPEPTHFGFFEYNSYANHLSRAFGIKGPRQTLMTACSSGAYSLASAMDALQSGEVNTAIVGGADGFSRVMTRGFQVLQNVSQSPCKPFDRDRSGLSFGEGAAFLVLEDLESAKARKASILCEVSGVGLFTDSYSITAPEPQGLGVSGAISDLLKRSDMRADEIDYVNAHGTATRLNDSAEALGVHRIISRSDLPISSLKGAIGHCMGAAGAVELAILCLAMKEQILLPTVGCDVVDPEIPLKVQTVCERKSYSNLIVLSAGFGGSFSAVGLRRYEA